MTFRIGVLPAASRNTPTPTSIFSGRGSALHSAISASSESAATGGRSASPLAFACVCVSMGARLATSRVVIHCHPVADRDRLAGQHITVRDLLVGETVMDCHFDLPLGYFRPARRTDPRLAGKRRRKARGPRAVEDVAGGEWHFASPAVERHCNRDAFGLRLQQIGRAHV